MSAAHLFSDCLIGLSFILLQRKASGNRTLPFHIDLGLFMAILMQISAKSFLKALHMSDIPNPAANSWGHALKGILSQNEQGEKLMF